MINKPFIVAAQRLGAALLYAPDPTTAGAAVVPDLSGNARDGTPKNGAALGLPGLIEDGAKAALDGTNDYIDTGWATRTNLIPNPNFEPETVFGWGANSGAVISRSTSEHYDGSASLKVVTAAAAFSGPLSESLAATAGQTYAVSGMAKIAAGEKVKIFLQYQNAKSEVLYSGGTSYTGTGAWQQLSHQEKAPVGTTLVRVFVLNDESEEHAFTFYLDCVLLEAATSVGSYFPTVAQLASGEAGWSGAAGNSASDIGPFARGTARTFVMLTKHASLALVPFQTVIGSSSAEANAPILLDVNNARYRSFRNVGAGEGEWPNPPSKGQVCLLGLVYDNGTGGNATLYSNGASLGQVAVPGSFIANPGNLRIGSAAAYGNYFDGSLLPFAVFTRALTVTELRDLALALGIIAPAPPVPKRTLRVVSIAEGGQGQGYELSPDVQGLQFSNVNPGGDEVCTFQVKRSWFLPNPELNRGNLLRVMDGIDILWQGRIEEADRAADTTESIAVTAYGLGVRLKDGLFQEIFIDRDTTQWGEGSTQRKINNLGATFAGRPYRYSQEFSVTSSDLTNGSGVAMNLSSVGAGTTPFGELVYYGAGVDLGKLRFDYRNMTGFGKDASMFDAVCLGVDDVTTNDVSPSFEQVTATNQTLNAAAAGRKYAFVQSTYIAALAEATYGNTRGFFNLCVLGRHGLTEKGSWPDIGFTVDQMVAYIVGLVSGITARQIDAQEYVVPQAAYKEPISHEDGITDLNKLENCDWGTWGPSSVLDTSVNGQFDFKTPDPTTQHWVINRADAEDMQLHSETATLYGSVQVTYQDESGITRTVTRTAKVPDLDAAGLSRKKSLNIGTAKPALAEAIADAFLAVWGQFAPARGSVTMKAPVRHYIRGLLGPQQMRADGANARLLDVLPSTSSLDLTTIPDRRTTFPIKRVQVDCSGSTPAAAVEVDQANESLSVLQARMDLESALIPS